jgi:glycosidase
VTHANREDRRLAARYEARERDWRNGAVVYQVLVDRFVPSTRLAAKRHLYPAPKRLRGWGEAPRRGRYLDDLRLWSHEIDFWGGDLESLATRLDHVQQLGADVLYLNPICEAYTNHKYDALDYGRVSPEYGTRDDVIALARHLHQRGMRLVLDGVFNHMGVRSPRFHRAHADHQARRAAASTATDGAADAPPNDTAAAGAAAIDATDWFHFGAQYPAGHRCWWGAPNLPELNLDNPAVRSHLWEAPDSVVRGWLRDGVDGWRLDVAFDIGFNRLQELTGAAHAQKPGSLVVGEIPNYPSQWMPAVDGVMHFALRRILLGVASGHLEGAAAGRMITRIVADTDFEHLLKSWIFLDNHDTERVATAVPDERRRRIAQLLQFTLPGSPNLYYGSEVGMTGGADPEMRAPMRWDLVDAGHAQIEWMRRLVALRRHRALRIGDFRTLVARELFAFERHTDRALDAVFVVVNPSDSPLDEWLLVTDSKIMDGTLLEDLLGQIEPVAVRSATLTLRVPPRTVLALKPVPPERARADGYSNYKRVQ